MSLAEVGQENEASTYSTALNSVHPEHSQFPFMMVSLEPETHGVQGCSVYNLKYLRTLVMIRHLNKCWLQAHSRRGQK
jgi:hypothetical protein